MIIEQSVIDEKRLMKFLKTGAPFGIDELNHPAIQRLVSLAQLAIKSRELFEELSDIVMNAPESVDSFTVQPAEEWMRDYDQIITEDY